MLAGSLASLQRLRLLSRGHGIGSQLRHCVHCHSSKISSRSHLKGLGSIVAHSSPLTTSGTDAMSDMNGNTGPVTHEEVEALRKQVEELKVIYLNGPSTAMRSTMRISAAVHATAHPPR